MKEQECDIKEALSNNYFLSRMKGLFWRLLKYGKGTIQKPSRPCLLSFKSLLGVVYGKTFLVSRKYAKTRSQYKVIRIAYINVPVFKKKTDTYGFGIMRDDILTQWELPLGGWERYKSLMWNLEGHISNE